MRAQDQAQPPPPPSPAPLQQPGGQPQQQSIDTECKICFNNVQPNEMINCNACRKQFHHDHLVTWLREALAKGRPQNCPHCRAIMTLMQVNQQPMMGAAVPAFIAPPVVPVIILPITPYNSANNTPPGLQPAELRDNIDNWNWNVLLQ
ncbi:unnamed protein product [Adineta steineri]|uniref:RING-type domain-containing protein n=1 Tax=Adineta steineri TaxID=433720 RepID=A0A813ZX16_9BILA|nr:unnamed protein product [Adineta steineri]CAF3943203.1 unnamed protein product [Adineta steineri]